VLNTVIESGDPAFQYSMQIPANEPPGLYWYHPHIHGNTSTQVDGGASGAIIVEGGNSLTQGLTERILILREQNKTGPARDPDANTQLTLNFQPAVYPEGGLAPSITLPERLG
jgi:FtsP/CotA-like multicopper oxidase with cupredoxin domain